jgi:PBP1b-binding outer membrane lipoprotein LpoB
MKKLWYLLILVLLIAGCVSEKAPSGEKSIEGQAPQSDQFVTAEVTAETE